MSQQLGHSVVLALPACLVMVCKLPLLLACTASIATLNSTMLQRIVSSWSFCVAAHRLSSC